jgi:hypothetical protein
MTCKRARRPGSFVVRLFFLRLLEAGLGFDVPVTVDQEMIDLTAISKAKMPSRR